MVRSLEAALWAFRRPGPFEEGRHLSVNLGDDADTTGAVHGQLAGAYYGYPGLPARLFERSGRHDLATLTGSASVLAVPEIAAGVAVRGRRHG